MSDEWNDQQVADLRKMFDAGMTGRQIAKAIGRTRNAVIGKLCRLGLHAMKNRTADNKPKRANRAFGSLVRKHKPIAPIAAEPPIAPIDYTGRPAPGYDGKSMLDLVAGECRYPIGDPAALFCAAPVAIVGGSWCLHHFRLCYQPARRPIPRAPADGRPTGLPVSLRTIL